ncbi:MAG: lipoprotein signal peptidase [Oscillospiraceae bacterium]|jgi:signal peptidase II|nr:lipoprotein signal peptidase [Oscillospiraceae bacterium]
MIFVALLAIILLIGVDQIIKLWALENLKDAAPIQFIKIGGKEIINLSYVENRGAAFSILQDKLIFLIIITSIFVIAGIILIVTKKIKNPLALASVSLVIAGGLGNLIDRISRGFVVDYIEIKLFKFAIFNFADCCVVIGAIMLLIYTLISDKAKKDALNV